MESHFIFLSALAASDRGVVMQVRLSSEPGIFAMKWISAPRGQVELRVMRMLRWTPGMVDIRCFAECGEHTLYELFSMDPSSDEARRAANEVKMKLWLESREMQFVPATGRLTGPGRTTSCVVVMRYYGMTLEELLGKLKKNRQEAFVPFYMAEAARQMRPLFMRMREMGLTHGDVSARNIVISTEDMKEEGETFLFEGRPVPWPRFALIDWGEASLNSRGSAEAEFFDFFKLPLDQVNEF